MLKRLEVKDETHGEWRGVAVGNLTLCRAMGRDFGELEPTSWSVKVKPNMRHFFTETGWEYCGQHLVKLAVENNIEHRVIELALEDVKRYIFRDRFQVVVTDEEHQPAYKVLYAGAGAQTTTGGAL